MREEQLVPFASLLYKSNGHPHLYVSTWLFWQWNLLRRWDNAKTRSKSIHSFIFSEFLSVSTVQSNSQWIIVISVTCLFSFVVLVFIVAAVYARRKAFLINGFGSHFAEPTDEPTDKWEVNSGDIALLEKLGDGFFGVAYKAYLYHSPSRPMSMLAQKESNSLGDKKSVVACKMLKGA